MSIVTALMLLLDVAAVVAVVLVDAVEGGDDVASSCTTVFA